MVEFQRNTHLAFKTENALLPAESLLAVIEVKSILTKAELEKCLKAAKKIRELKPYKSNFVSPKKDGDDSIQKNCRCFYSIIAFDSNISKKDWLQKEWKRAQDISTQLKIKLDVIDRIFVLNKGIIAPAFCSGKQFNDVNSGALLEWFLQLINFLNRENKRRHSVDLQIYFTKSSKGWENL